MDVAELRAIYTATSADFDRVTDHVQKRLKDTQNITASKSGQSQVVKEAAAVQSSILKTVEQGRQAFVKSQIEASEKAAAGTIKSTKQSATAAAEEAKVRLGFLKTIEAGRQDFVASQIKAAETEAKGIVEAAKKIAPAVQAGTTKFDATAFWARQGVAATNAAKNAETETKKAASSVTATLTNAVAVEEGLHARRAAAATKATSTVVRDAKTGATLTQAELAKIISGSSKVVETEAKKVGQATGGILNDLKKLFLSNNFLFRQLGQRIAGDAGFAAAGIGKLAINFKDLAAASGGAAAELEGAAGSIVTTAGALGPIGIAIAVVAAGLAAVEIAGAAAAFGLFSVAKSVSDTEEHFADLNRQTGLSVDNLQALDIGGRSSGTTLDRLNTSVGQLERKLIDASEGGTSRLSIGLRKLGIDANDPNRALSQLIDLLGKLPAGTVRTGAAMQIFGRGGKDVAGVVGEIVDQVGSADGALARFKQSLIDAGVHINTDGVETAEKFHKQIVLLEAQFESFKKVVGEEALPTVLEAATKFSNWIATNRVQIGEWARDIEHVAEAIVSLAASIAKLIALTALPIIVELRIVPSVTNFAANVAEGGPLAGIAKQLGEAFGTQGPEESGLALFTPNKQADAVAKRIRDAFAAKGRSGGKGEDPAQTARRLAEIALQETLKGLQAEHDALQRQLDLNLVARDKYTQDAINLELKRRQATIDGLNKELAEAERIRKPGQRAIRVAEVNARIREEEKRSATEVQKITDDSAAEQLRIGQALAESQVRIVETQVDRIKARIRDYADFRLITEAQAAEFEEQQTLRVFNVRRHVLEKQQQLLVAGSEKYQEIQNQLNQIDVERDAFLEASGRNKEAALRNDAQHVIQFAAQIREALQRAEDLRLEAGEASLEPLRNSILTRHQLWDAELQFEITREEQRHDRTMQQFKDEAATAKIRIKNEQELAQTLAGIHAQESAEEQLHQAKLRQIATQAAEQRRQELLQVADDLANIAEDIFSAIGKSSKEFWNNLSQSAQNFAKRIGSELFKGLLEKAITGQAQGAEGLIGAIINPLLGAKGKNAAVADNTKATQANTAALNALTQTMGGTPAVSSGLSGVLQFIPGLFGGGRATGGPAEAGKVYRVHENEVFFRPNISGQIYNLDKLSKVLSSSSGEVRTIVALGDDAVGEAMESHRITPEGRRAAIVRGRWNRKTGGLQFV